MRPSCTGKTLVKIKQAIHAYHFNNYDLLDKLVGVEMRRNFRKPAKRFKRQANNYAAIRQELDEIAPATKLWETRECKKSKIRISGVFLSHSICFVPT